MGSKSYSVSTTNYNNTPQTVSDKGIALASSNLVTGFQGTQNNQQTLTGSTINNLDGGAIASAFGFGSDLIKGVFQAQKDNNASIIATNSQASGLINKSQELVDKKENKELAKDSLLTKNLMIAAVVAIAFFYFKKS